MRRSAYYSRAGSFSRSFNAMQAEEEGRLPRSRAATKLGLSVAAFDAGCRAANYQPCEWHHVGKYASRIDYYNWQFLESSEAFWRGAAAAYKSAAKQREVLAKLSDAVRRIEQERAQEREEERQHVLRRFRNQWLCPVRVHRHDGMVNWTKFVRKAFASAGCPYGDGETPAAVKAGDFESLKARVQKRLHDKANPPKEKWSRVMRERFRAAGVPYRTRETLPPIHAGDWKALEARVAARCADKGIPYQAQGK